MIAVLCCVKSLPLHWFGFCSISAKLTVIFFVDLLDQLYHLSHTDSFFFFFFFWHTANIRNSWSESLIGKSRQNVCLWLFNPPSSVLATNIWESRMIKESSREKFTSCLSSVRLVYHCMRWTCSPWLLKATKLSHPCSNVREASREGFIDAVQPFNSALTEALIGLHLSS